jgi:hypothetical protein
MKATITHETIIENVTRINLEHESGLYLSVSRGRNGYLISTGLEHKIIPYSRYAFEVVLDGAAHPFMESDNDQGNRRAS